MKSLVILCFLTSSMVYCQPNCNVYLWSGDTSQYNACKLVEGIDDKYYQFSRAYQELMDEALEICPYFAYAYREKAATYIKSGNFLTWKKLIDLAVKYDPVEYLGERASLRSKFFADYAGAIKDIDRLEHLMSSDIGYSHDGTYHLDMVKALCYKAMGNRNKAIEIMELHISDPDYYAGLYDYLHLGVLYLVEGKYEKAEIALHNQIANNDLAENHYYLSLVYDALGKQKERLIHLHKSKTLFQKGAKMIDGYNELFDQIYLKEIEQELKTAHDINDKSSYPSK